VPSLSVADEAVELFANRARLARTSFTVTDDNAAVMTEICRRLDGAGAADSHLLGQQLAVLFEGATAMATSLNDTAPVVHARAAAATLIDAVLSA
jgi:predicted ATPase